MTQISILQARNALMDTLSAAWTAGAAAIVGTVPPIRFPGQVDGNLPPDDGYWVMAGVQHVTGAPSSIGGKSFEHAGLLTVQIFGRAEDQGLEKLDQLAQLVVDAFEGQQADPQIWFRDVSVREVGPLKGWFQVQVVAEWVYTTRKVG